MINVPSPTKKHNSYFAPKLVAFIGGNVVFLGQGGGRVEGGPGHPPKAVKATRTGPQEAPIIRGSFNTLDEKVVKGSCKHGRKT